METCVKQQHDAVLVEGTPGFLRGDMGLQSFAIPPLVRGDLELMVSELKPFDAEKIAGYTTFDVKYGAEDKFRLTVLGEPAISILVTRIATDVPSWAGRGAKWAVPETAKSLSLDEILTNGAIGYVRDAILVPGYPPLGWSRYGVHANVAPPLSYDEWASDIAEAKRRAGELHQARGCQTLCYQLQDVASFAVALFEGNCNMAVFVKLAGNGTVAEGGE